MKWREIIASAGYPQVNCVEFNNGLPSWRERLVREYLFHRGSVNVNFLMGLVKRRETEKAIKHQRRRGTALGGHPARLRLPRQPGR